MVLSGFLGASDRPSAGRAKVTVESQDLQAEYIHDEAQLPCIPPERPNLRDLNSSLAALAAVFPDVQVEVFRELLSNFDGESRLALVADALLKNRVDWVKGRWRTVEPLARATEGVPRVDAFRSREYVGAVRALAWHEFRGLSRSTINAVLAESNHSYLDARRTLVALSTKSWRFTISSLFLRRRPVAKAENHPLVVWRPTGRGHLVPAIRTSGNAELDRELYDALVRPVQERERAAREAGDRTLAAKLNDEEAEAAEATHECMCCFVACAFEHFTSCTRRGHMICFRCVRESIKEALFGQGWTRNINAETGTLKCPAVDGDECAGCIPSDHIHRALTAEASGADMLHKLDQRLAEHSLVGSRLPLIHCPFCSYAEVDDIFLPSREGRPRICTGSVYKLLFLCLCLCLVVLTMPALLLSSLVCLLLTTHQTLWKHAASEWQKALTRHCRRRRGLRFSCQNPRCGRVSCLSCHKSWTDIHVCHESSLVALRTQVEQAMSMAVKRVCPRCSTSFVKNAGCNKLTCPCGYKMCYVCRANLDDEGYRHFCDHFRPDGDPRPCTECDRCNLWQSEDTERVLAEARAEAEHRWREAEQRDLSGAEKAFVETGVAVRAPDISLGRLFSRGRVPTLADVLDLAVEILFV
ncbi:RING finger protein [Drechmeria coniospora]|uniref:RING finger protein n=1 Tax=Drechmeria coniospora TaxID=98403 RepID=A0A151GQZ0_DRECN|nr:RING finger protein [Drechmeria coniospora]KYK59527.1 RING finger protein [Drechmeria coniospora]ODA76233.1 hypothetical protein RJ55_08078 [Drechmeria coniospora]